MMITITSHVTMTSCASMIEATIGNNNKYLITDLMYFVPLLQDK